LPNGSPIPKGASKVTSKGGIDLVTETDVACEDAVRTTLTGALPAYPVIGEERGGTPQSRRPYWLVDPICGTRAFASEVPLWCSNIALVEDGTVTAAAIGVGVIGELLYAEKGGGAWSRTSSGDARINVSDQSSILWMDTSTDLGAAAVQRALTLKRWYVWLFSSTVSYAYLAMGRIAGILQLLPPSARTYGSMHTAAGCFIAKEAGAIVSDFDTGKDWALTTRRFVLASTGALHRELTDLVKEAGMAKDKPARPSTEAQP
jgi:myo-inositol-1(or 4)-monophosphatase